MQHEKISNASFLLHPKSLIPAKALIVLSHLLYFHQHQNSPDTWIEKTKESADRQVHNDTLMRPNQTTTRAKEADIRSHSQDYINTHLLLVPFKRHQSAAYSVPCKKREWSRLHVRDPSLYMFSGCVLTTQKGGGLSVGVPTTNLLLHAKVVCQKIVQVTSDGLWITSPCGGAFVSPWHGKL